MNKFILSLSLIISVLAGSLMCQDSSKPAENKCDSTLWDRVYDTDRFIVIDKCVELTGTVWEKPTEEGDADYHILIRLDSSIHYILNSKNYELKDSCLVAEVVCAVEEANQSGKANVTFLYWLLYADLPSVCDNYHNNIYIPRKGEHVRISGPLVIDKGEYPVVKHGWVEIHPVTKMEVLK